MTMLALINLAYHDQNFTTYESRVRLAAKCDVAPSTFTAYLSELAKAGWLTQSKEEWEPTYLIELNFPRVRELASRLRKPKGPKVFKYADVGPSPDRQGSAKMSPDPSPPGLIEQQAFKPPKCQRPGPKSRAKKAEQKKLFVDAISKDFLDIQQRLGDEELKKTAGVIVFHYGEGQWQQALAALRPEDVAFIVGARNPGAALYRKLENALKQHHVPRAAPPQPLAIARTDSMSEPEPDDEPEFIEPGYPDEPEGAELMPAEEDYYGRQSEGFYKREEVDF